MLKGPSKRFYKHAECSACADGYGVSLDGRTVNTPLGEALIVPSAVLAQEIASEWQGQGDKIVPDTMPMMRLACTAIDKLGPNRDNIVEQMCEYGANDLLCYRAEGPVDLVERQTAIWQPLLDWAGDSYGAGLESTSGIVHISQPEKAISKLRRAVDDHDDFEMTALAEITQLTGSLVLGLAFSSDHIGWEEALDASQLDETWQNERWGEDYEAADRKKNRRSDMETTARFLMLVRTN